VQFAKLVYVESDTLVLKNLDHLFELDTNSVHVAMPLAHWLGSVGTNTLMVLRPSLSTYDEIMQTFTSWRKASRAKASFDMDIVNTLNWTVMPCIYCCLDTLLQAPMPKTIRACNNLTFTSHDDVVTQCMMFHFSHIGKPWAPRRSQVKTPALEFLLQQWTERDRALSSAAPGAATGAAALNRRRASHHVPREALSDHRAQLEKLRERRERTRHSFMINTSDSMGKLAH
jgi:lipopolysaccharide biosynthesis glycosyltransferase